MARARNIKPGFFINDGLAVLPYEARLLFIGLWTIADRRGRLEDRPRRIKAAIFPYDDVDTDAALQSLHDSPERFITRYEADGMRYIQIANFERHQSPHKNESESIIPAPEQHHTSTVQAPEQHPCTHAESVSPFSDSLNPDSLNYESLSEEGLTPLSPDGDARPPAPPYGRIVEQFNSICTSLSNVRRLTDTRKKAIKSACKLLGETSWEDYFKTVEASDFLTGRANSSDRQWVADFDWVLKPANMIKILEGNYANRDQKQKQPDHNDPAAYRWGEE